MHSNSTSSSRTPVTLIHRLREGHNDDWETFHAIYGPMIYKVAELNRLQAHDAEEIVAIVMKSLMQGLMAGLKVDHDRGRFRDYVAAATLNAIKTYRRGNPRASGVSIQDVHVAAPHPTAHEQLVKLEEAARMRLCLERLRRSPQTRQRNYRAFVRYVLQDESAKGVASRYGITIQRLYEIKREMLERLERMLSELDKTLGEA